MNRKTKIHENKAITLIALVITIIVLIILAGVTINLTLGQNGLFTRAKQASEDLTKGVYIFKNQTYSSLIKYSYCHILNAYFNFLNY